MSDPRLTADELMQAVLRLTAENAALREELATLKAGIKAELGEGNSLPDFWTAERQLPYVTKALTAARAERDALKQEAKIQAQEMRTHRATVREIYQICSGATGEPGDWHGANPVKTLAAERDALKAELAVLVNNAISDPLTVDYAQRLIRMERELAEARAESARMKRLALEATNGWACRATREIELDEISRLHQEISSLPAPPAETKARVMPIPAEDKAATIDAIHALLKVKR